jgi:tellurite resistance-related uncharacterized protein
MSVGLFYNIDPAIPAILISTYEKDSGGFPIIIMMRGAVSAFHMDSDCNVLFPGNEEGEKKDRK